jgi:hypothetical protein
MPEDVEKLIKKAEKKDPGHTVAGRDVLQDPLLAPTLRDRHSPLDRTSSMEPGTPGSGSLTTTVSRYGKTLDVGSGTTAFLHQKEMNPSLSDDELWERALQYDINPGGEHTDLNGSDNRDYSGKKLAYVVGNSTYPGTRFGDLPGAASDASSMAGHYEGKGYETFHAKNVTAAQLESGVQALEQLEDDDAGVLYYAGHGSSRGLWGVDSVSMPNSVISGTTSTVLGKGARLDVVVDACHAGGLQDEMEDEFDVERGGHDLDHVTAAESAKVGYGVEPTDLFLETREEMLMEGEQMLGGWHMSHKKGTQVDER